jgi:hypothetical protein
MATPNNPNIRKTAEELAFLKDAINSIGETVKDTLNSRLEESDSILQRIQNNIKKETSKSLMDLSKGFDSVLKSQIELAQGTLKQSDITRQINNLLARRQATNIALKQAERNGLIDANERKSIEREVNEQLKLQQKLLKQQQTQYNKIQDRLGITGKLVTGISKIPVLGNLIDSEKVLGDVQTEAAKRTSSRAKVMNTAFSSIGTSIKKGLSDPLTLTLFAIKALGEGVLRTDKIQTDLRKNLALSRTEALGLQENFSAFALVSDDVLATTTSLAKSMGALQTQLGFVGNVAVADLAQFNRITEAIGASEQAAAGLQKQAVLQGVSLETNKNIALETTQAVSSQLGVQLNHKEILDAVGKASNYTLAQFRGSTKELTQTVARAKALGLELSDIASTSAKLLNFQSSIEDELSAELLTGKQLNLEQARYYALTNQTGKLQEEIVKNVGNLSEFQNMNALAQQQFASALGLSVEKVADILTLEQYRGKTYKEISALAGEEVANRVEALNLQQQFNAVITKLQQALVDIAAGPIGTIASVLLELLSNTAMLSGAVAGFLLTGGNPIGALVGAGLGYGASKMFGEGKSQTLGSSVGAGSGTYRNTSGTTASNTTSQQNVRVTPSTTVVQLNMDSANVGNAMARSNYRISSNIKQFGGTGIDASATV